MSNDLTEKSGAIPARSRRCKEEEDCKMSLHENAGRRNRPMMPSQKNCLTKSHRYDLRAMGRRFMQNSEAAR